MTDHPRISHERLAELAADYVPRSEIGIALRELVLMREERDLHQARKLEITGLQTQVADQDGAITAAATQIAELTAQRDAARDNANTWHTRADAHRQSAEFAEKRIERLESALSHVRSSAQTGTSDAGVVISFAALAAVRSALAAADGQQKETLRESVDRVRAEIKAEGLPMPDMTPNNFGDGVAGD